MIRVTLTLAILLLPLQATAAETFRLAHIFSDESTTGKLLQTLARASREQNGPAIKLLGRSSVGRSRDYLDMVRYGKLDMALVSLSDSNRSQASGSDNRLPELGVFDLPFLVRDGDHLKQVLDGPVRDQLADAFQRRGVELLAVFYGTFRILGMSRDFGSIADFKGIKLRVMDPNSGEWFQRFGASSVLIPSSDLFRSVERGMIDGFETTLTGLTVGGLDKVSKQILLTKHLYQPLFLIANRERVKALSGHERDALKQSARDAQEISFSLGAEGDARLLDQLRRNGIGVREMSKDERERLIEPSRFLYDEYATQTKRGAELVELFLWQ